MSTKWLADQLHEPFYHLQLRLIKGQNSPGMNLKSDRSMTTAVSADLGSSVRWLKRP
jgi:hypothetical protein